MTHYRKWTCSKCGNVEVEPVAWRGHGWEPDWEIGDFAEFESAYLEIAKHLKLFGSRNGTVAGDYYYWRRKSTHLIFRIPVSIYHANGNRCTGQGTYMESTRTRERERLDAQNMKLTEPKLLGEL